MKNTLGLGKSTTKNETPSMPYTRAMDEPIQTTVKHRQPGARLWHPDDTSSSRDPGNARIHCSV
jgi:hypothetical protein